MTAVHVASEVHDSPEWHAVRRNGIGASEIAAVVGLHPWTSAFALWHQKKGNLGGSVETGPTRWGHILEPVVADEFAERHPEFVVANAGTYRNSDHDWQFANADRILFEAGRAIIPSESRPNALLEIKTSRFGDGFGKTGTQQIPMHVACQVQQQLDVFGLPYAWVAVLIGGSDYREYVIDADPEAQRSLREAGETFWQSVLNDEEPPMDASFATYEAVRALHPDIDRGEEVAIPVGDWNQLQEYRAEEERYAGLHRYFKASVLAAMGRAQFATVAGQRVARRQAKGTGTPYLIEIKGD